MPAIDWEFRVSLFLLNVAIAQPSLNRRGVMQELHDARLLQKFRPGEGRRASEGIVLLVVVADGGVETLSRIESRADRVAMVEVALLRRGSDARKIRVEDPVKPGPAHDAPNRTIERLHIDIINGILLGDLHQVTTHSRGSHRPHLILLLDRHFGLTKRSDGLLD